MRTGCRGGPAAGQTQQDRTINLVGLGGSRRYCDKTGQGEHQEQAAGFEKVSHSGLQFERCGAAGGQLLPWGCVQESGVVTNCVFNLEARYAMGMLQAVEIVLSFSEILRELRRELCPELTQHLRIVWEKGDRRGQTKNSLGDRGDRKGTDT